MRTVIKIAIALALINAAVRTGLVALDYYQLKDAAQQEAIFGGRTPPSEIATHVLEKAEELNVPLARNDLEVTRQGDLTMIRGVYTQPVELFPRFVYPFELSFAVEARVLAGLR
jgi:hypothetical protein